jgi:hypothetical protein
MPFFLIIKLNTKKSKRIKNKSLDIFHSQYKSNIQELVLRQNILAHTYIHSHPTIRVLFIRMFHEKTLVERTKENMCLLTMYYTYL